MNPRIDLLSRALAAFKVTAPVGRISTSHLRALHTAPRLCAISPPAASPPSMQSTPPKTASSAPPASTTANPPPPAAAPPKSLKPPQQSSQSQPKKDKPYTGSDPWTLSRALVRIDHAVSPNKIERLTYILTRSYPLLHGIIKPGRPSYIFIEGPTPKLTQFIKRLSVLQLFNSTATLDVQECELGGGEESKRKWLPTAGGKDSMWAIVDDVKRFKNRLKGLGLGRFGIKAFEDERRVFVKVHGETKLIKKAARRARGREKKKRLEGKKVAEKSSTVDKLAAM